MEPEAVPPQLVLFSGGRDSTLAASILMLRDIPVILYTGDSKCGLHRDIVQYRLAELKNRFGSLMREHVVEDMSGTVRAIALENIESDILKYRKNLILLGEKLAIHVHAANFCRRRAITVVNDGIVSYQSDLPEQRDVAKQFIAGFMAEYGVEYRSPIYNVGSADDVKYKLLQLGLSTKSLEGVSIFGDTFSVPSDEAVVGYLQDKAPLAHRILAFLAGGEVAQSTRGNIPLYIAHS
jgi:hypothetical protein